MLRGSETRPPFASVVEAKNSDQLESLSKMKISARTRFQHGFRKSAKSRRRTYCLRFSASKSKLNPCRGRAQRAKTRPTQHENALFMLRTWGSNVSCTYGSSFSRHEISSVDLYATGINSQPENKPKVSKATAKNRTRTTNSYTRSS
jgi:hypothetical protein